MSRTNVRGDMAISWAKRRKPDANKFKSELNVGHVDSRKFEGAARRRVKLEDWMRSLPVEWPVELRAQIQKQVKDTQCKVVVLDDDPTGTQTVHGIPVLTEWPIETLQKELENDLPAFYMLTNSRSLTPLQARSINTEIGHNLVQAAQRANRQFVTVSRSDSTLRGHFPGEVEALTRALGQSFDGWIIIPFFLEGGRYTLGDIHYVHEGSWLVPAGETEYARDSTFGYRSSNLRHWVEEKTEGRISSGDVASISIEDIREGGPNRVKERLLGIRDGKICVVNAIAYRDLDVFVGGLLAAEAQGRRFIYRTAASFVQVRAGLFARPLLTCSDLDMPESGGALIVVGSYVPKTSAQITTLLSLPQITSVQVNVEALLDESRRQEAIEHIAQSAERELRNERTVVIYTSRELVTGNDPESNLSIGSRVSDGLISILGLISTRPRYLIAKGGITSSDVATKGLGVKRALVLGQILPGVPVWQLGTESKYPSMPYIVFPGNVGGPGALAEAVNILKPSSTR
jgi:uncharacterized protein YgbK (DUF1537 family)